MRGLAVTFIFSLLLLASCSEPGAHRIAWSKSVDSLLHDSVPLHAYADSFRTQVLSAGSDTAAVRALAGMAEFLPSAIITTVADDAAAHCPKSNELLLADIRCKQGIGLFRRQKSDSAAQLFRESLRMARKLNNTALEVQALCWLGDYYRLAYKFDSCEATLNAAIRIARPAKLYRRIAHAQSFIGDLYRIQDQHDTALIIYDEAIKNARLGNDPARESFLLANVGETFRLQVNYDSAAHYLNRSLAVATKLNDNSRKAFALSNLADLARLEGKNPQALTNYNLAIEAAAKSGEKRRINYCLVNLSELYSSQGKNDIALEMASRAYKNAVQQGEKTVMTSSLQSCGELYRKAKNYTAADTCYRKAASIAAGINNQMREAVSVLALADLYIDQHNFDSAYVYAVRGEAIARNIEDPNNIADAERILSVVYFNQRNLAKATQYGEAALARAKKSNLSWVISSASLTLEAVYREAGNTAKAYEMFRLHISVRDSLEGKEQYQRLAAAEYEAKESTLKAEQARKEATLESDKARQQQQIERQRFQIWIAAGGAVLLGGLLFVALRAYRSKQRANLIIAEQKQQVEAQKLLVEVKNKEVMDSITYARRLQEAILPRTEHIQQILPESFVLYLPKDVVAGDFYFFVERGPLLFLAAADCTGHGVPGALVSVVCSNALKRAVNEFQLSEPGEILDKTTELVLETFSQSGSQVNDGMDITLLVIDKNAKTCKWAGANRPLWTVTNGQISQLKGDARPVGHHDDPLPFTTHEPVLNDGTMIYLFSDGYADQFGGASGKKFKTRQLQDVFLKISALPASKQKEELENTFQNWKSNFEQVDDVCIIGLRF